MERRGRRSDLAGLWRRLQRLRLECRECEVICERVVSPYRCLRSGCSAIYSYQDGDTTYFGCVHKVFAPELDLAAFSERGRRVRRGVDPYGLIRVSRPPRPECPVTIEQAYDSPAGTSGCCNPTFFQHPGGPAEDSIRLIDRSAADSDRDPQG
jgi:hypothetical protein